MSISRFDCGLAPFEEGGACQQSRRSTHVTCPSWVRQPMSRIMLNTSVFSAQCLTAQSMDCAYKIHMGVECAYQGI
jgi:hypothetical protein